MENLFNILRDNFWNGIVGIITIIGVFLTGVRYISQKDNQSKILSSVQGSIKTTNKILRAVLSVLRILLTTIIKVLGWLFTLPQGAWTSFSIGLIVGIKSSGTIEINPLLKIPFGIVTGAASTLFVFIHILIGHLSNNVIEQERVRNKLKDLESEILEMKRKGVEIISSETSNSQTGIKSSKDENYYRNYKRNEEAISIILLWVLAVMVFEFLQIARIP